MADCENIKDDVKIAYLAPEMPALSATFVYQEILELKNIGLCIIPISIHKPASVAQGDKLKELEQETFYLYEQSFLNVFLLNIFLVVSSPVKYLSVFRLALSDSINVGIMSHIGKGLLYRFFMAACLVQYLRKKNITHIHSNFAHIPTDIAMYAAALHGVTFSFLSHANDLFERGWLLKEKVARAKFAVTISEYNKRFLVDKGASEEKIHVIHCGVNTNAFSCRDTHELGTPPLLGTLGRMVEKKGFDVLIKACDHLRKEGVKFKLQIAGGGPLKSDLEELASRLELSESIEFMDSISHKDVPNWIKLLDMFVLPCQQDKQGDMDGIPVVLMEAMLSGVPVISSRISGIPELVIDEVTGLLCEVNDAISLANKIKIILTNIELKDDLCKKAILKVKSEFELQGNVKVLAEKFLE